MRNFLVVLGILAIAVVAGCGGSGSTPAPVPGPTLLETSTDGKITLTGGASSVPAGVTVTVETKAASEFPTPIADAVFVAGASVAPEVTFNSIVTLTFTLSTAVASGTEVRLYRITENNSLEDTGILATMSADGLTATAELPAATGFNTSAFALLKG